MKSILRFVLKNKLAVWLLAIILVCTGLYSASNMKMETIPDITIPIITVMTVYPGATPEQVMEDVSIPIEKAVTNLKGVSVVNSTSYSNMSSIQIEFEYQSNMVEAEREIKTVIDSVRLPEATQKSTIKRISMNSFPVVAFSISSQSETIEELTRTVQEMVVPKLEGIDGVSSVSISGQHVNKIELSFDKAKMKLFGLTEETVKQIIQESDSKIPLGLYPFEEKEQSVVVDGKIITIDGLRNLLIPVTPTFMNPNPFISLGDIATFNMVGKVESISRTNGKEAIAVQIIKAQDANTVEVVNEAKGISNELESSINGLIIDTTLDQGIPIEESVETMIDKALFGAGFAILIILLFLHDMKSTIISVISIPLSILIAFTVLYYLDITLNIMTLGAMTVAIGRVIDDSIVVVENIYRRLHLREEKLKGRALICSATLEMFKPILSSTLVTIAVFAPLVFVGGMVGELFMPFALTITLALVASLIVAITIVPSLSHTLFSKTLYTEVRGYGHRSQTGILAKFYKKILAWILNHKFTTSSLAVVILIASLFLLPKVGFSFIPGEEQKVMYLTYTPEPGETREVMIQNVSVVEQELMTNGEVDIVQVSIGGSGNKMLGGGTDRALMTVIFDSETKNFTKKRVEIENYVLGLNQTGTWKSQHLHTSMTSNELEFKVYGNRLKEIEQVVAEIKDIMGQSQNLKDISSSISERFDEYTLKVNQKTLLQYGLTTVQIAMMLHPNIPEEVITTIDKDGQDIEVIIQKNKVSPLSFQQLLEQQIPTPYGTTIRLRDIVGVKKGTTLNTTSRSEGKLYATVSGTITNKDVRLVSREIEERIKQPRAS